MPGDRLGHATQREREAWESRYKHAKAARAWEEIAVENADKPGRVSPAVCRILAEWMRAYEEADAAAERAFRDLAAVESESKGDIDG